MKVYNAMTFYVFTKIENENILSYAKSFCKRAVQLGCRCVSDLKTVEAIDKDISVFDPSQHTDYVVSIGGDGTMLAAARVALAHSLPIFGINAGRIGFLCAFDKDDISSITIEDIERLVPSPRALLEVSCGEKFLQYALNDVAVTKFNYSRTVEFELKFGNNSMGTILADGVIAATPTGSTGYSLSAGGPIVDPSLESVVVTSICAHSTFSRGYVLSKNECVRIIPAKRFKNDFQISVDGDESMLCPTGTEISCRLSERKLNLLVSENRNFYDILFKELSFGRQNR